MKAIALRSNIGRDGCLRLRIPTAYPNRQVDMEYLKHKVDAGASYIVTQMFFDNEYYFAFVKNCREAGITVPIIPGLKPITTLRDINTLPQVFNIDIPEDLVKSIAGCKNNEEAFHVGVEWSVQQSKELIRYGVPVLHYFTIGISENIRQIVSALF